MGGPRRVVVTGLGLVSPLGTGVEFGWQRLLRGETATRCCTRLSQDRLLRLPCQVAAEVEHGEGIGQFELSRWVPPELRRNTRPYVHYALGAGQQALSVRDCPDQDLHPRLIRRQSPAQCLTVQSAPRRTRDGTKPQQVSPGVNGRV
jgi:3-oxoacyl-[acyl-carrier-protein] synthase II